MPAWKNACEKALSNFSFCRGDAPIRTKSVDICPLLRQAREIAPGVAFPCGAHEAADVRRASVPRASPVFLSKPGANTAKRATWRRYFNPPRRQEMVEIARAFWL